MKIISLVILFAISESIFSQPTITPINTNYQEKNKTQKELAITLAAGGGVLGFIGLTKWSNGFADGLDFSNPDHKAGTKDMKSANTLFIAGGAMLLSSIPLFMASAKNKSRRMNLVFKK